MSAKVTNPYAPGTANSKLFRIPAMYTLKNGRIIACADIRYGNGCDDPANIETALRYSDDNGATWSHVKLINHFNDMEDCDYNVAIPTSASFIDSAIVEGEDNVVFHVCDACPAYMGLWSKGTYGKGNGYIDNKLVFCDKTSPDKAESTTLDKAHYPYYADDFGDDGFAPVKRFSDNSVYNNYFIDKAYNLYESKNGEYTPVLIKQMKNDGTLSDVDIQANTFYAYSPIKMYPTYYLWVKVSTDGGETFGDGEIINTQINSKGFTGFAPGRGITLDVNGKKRTLFAIYDNNEGKEYTSVIYTDDGGKTWQRSEKAKKVGSAGKGSETQFVLMSNGVLRMYSRNCAKYIGYSDSTDFGVSWSEYTLDKDLKYCGNCQFSVINYSKKIDGKDAIIISYPTEKTRKCGAVKTGLYGNDNKVKWQYRKNITTDLLPFTFVYSCLTEDKNGRVIDLYESYKAELSVTDFDINELMVKESNLLSPIKKIKSKILNITKK